MVARALPELHVTLPAPAPHTATLLFVLFIEKGFSSKLFTKCHRVPSPCGVYREYHTGVRQAARGYSIHAIINFRE